MLRDRVEEISLHMENEEMRARVTMSNLLSQQNGPMSVNVSQFQDDHEHQMESLGRQLRQQQDDLQRLQRERAAKYVTYFKTCSLEYNSKALSDTSVMPNSPFVSKANTRQFGRRI